MGPDLVRGLRIGIDRFVHRPGMILPRLPAAPIPKIPSILSCEIHMEIWWNPIFIDPRFPQS